MAISAERMAIITKEGAEALRRYNFIAPLTAKFLQTTALVLDKPWSQEDPKSVEAFCVASAKVSHPLVRSVLWDHFVLCEIYGGIIPEENPQLGLNADQTASLALLHHLGGIIEPATRTRNAILTRSLLRKAGVKAEYINIALPKLIIQGVAGEINGIEELSPSQRIIDIIENLGKTSAEGEVYTVAKTRQDLDRLVNNRPDNPFNAAWPSELTGQVNLWGPKARQILALNILYEEIAWAEGAGINFEKLQKRAESEYYGCRGQTFLTALKRAQAQGAA